MKILVTGANGMVARATIEHCRALGDEVLQFAKQQFDISQREIALRILEQTKPNALINCAAYTDVDAAETRAELCYQANCFGVENLALATKSLGAKFVTISTDYVFDGEKSGFYTEEDEPNPLGIYGKSKLEGENRALEANKNCIVVRSGWIYGEGGTNFLSVLPDLLCRGKKVNAIADSFGTPTYARDLASQMRDLAAFDVKGIFHIANSGEGTSYEEFAREICKILAADYSLIESVSMSEMKRAAPRPRNSRLQSVRAASSGLRALRGWRAALSDFIERKKKRPF